MVDDWTLREGGRERDERRRGRKRERKGRTKRMMDEGMGRNDGKGGKTKEGLTLLKYILQFQLRSMSKFGPTQTTRVME